MSNGIHDAPLETGAAMTFTIVQISALECLPEQSKSKIAAKDCDWSLQKSFSSGVVDVSRAPSIAARGLIGAAGCTTLGIASEVTCLLLPSNRPQLGSAKSSLDEQVTRTFTPSRSAIVLVARQTAVLLRTVYDNPAAFLYPVEEHSRQHQPVSQLFLRTSAHCRVLRRVVYTSFTKLRASTPTRHPV